jgi:hypothetical protein
MLKLLSRIKLLKFSDVSLLCFSTGVTRAFLSGPPIFHSAIPYLRHKFDKYCRELDVDE